MPGTNYKREDYPGGATAYQDLQRRQHVHVHVNIDVWFA